MLHISGHFRGVHRGFIGCYPREHPAVRPLERSHSTAGFILRAAHTLTVGLRACSRGRRACNTLEVV
jgi:hypothetical protein